MAHTEKSHMVRVGSVVLALIIVFGTVLTFVPGAMAASDGPSAERTIDKTKVSPGESVTVSVTIDLNETGGPFLVEDFSSPFQDLSLVSDDPRTQISGPNNANTQFTAGWDSEGTSYSLTYEVTIPDNATHGDTFVFNGSVDVNDQSVDIGGQDTITVSTAERSISNNQLNPGESTNVTVVITDTANNTPFLNETITPGAGNVELISATPEISLGGANTANTEFTAGWDQIATEYSITYQVTVGENDTDGDTYKIKGTVSQANQSANITGPSTITVATTPDSPDDYADSSNGEVDSGGVGNAFSDWQRGIIDPSLLSEVFQAWQRGEIVLG